MVTPPDPGALLGRITGRVADGVLEHVDTNAVLDGIDVNALLDRIDVEALLDRIDVDRLMARVDVDALMARVDIEALVRRSGVPEIVEQSTSRFAGSALDSLRRQMVSLDLLTGFVIDRLLGRRRLEWAFAPVGLRPAEPRMRDGSLDISGRYAGAVPRLLAVIADLWLLSVGSTLALAGSDYLTTRLFGWHVDTERGWWWVPVFAFIAFCYSFFSLEVAGRTPGKALVGLRVVRWDGSDVSAWPAFVRTVMWPLSIVLAGVGLVVLLVQRDRRALHDLLARTAVVYDWAPRPVLLRPSMSAKLLERAPASRAGVPAVGAG